MAEAVVTIVKRRKVAYQRELQVVLERPPDIEHWDITNTLRKLVSVRVLTTKKYRKLRWYFDSRLNWESVVDLANAKADLVDYYTNYPYKFASQPEGVQYDDYAEYLVEDALIHAGFVVTGKSTNYFNGRYYLKQAVAPGRPPDLDFTTIEWDCRLAVGVSIKNKLDYPTDDEIDLLLDICQVLQLRPVLVARMASGKSFLKVHGAGGRILAYKRWLLQPGMPTNKFYAISDAGKEKSLLGLPLSIYRYTWDFLVDSFKELKISLSSKKG